MKGTGVKEDPFKVTTASEFIEAWQAQVLGNATYIELENDIDFNDVLVYSPIVNTATEYGQELYGGIMIDGKNHKMTNIFSDDLTGGFFTRKIVPPTSNTSERYNEMFQIKNMVIEAVLMNHLNEYCTLFQITHTKKNGGSEYGNNLIFDNIDFRIKYYNRITKSGSTTFYTYGIVHNGDSTGPKVNFYNCTFNIDASMTKDNQLFGCTSELSSNTAGNSYTRNGKYFFKYCSFKINLYVSKYVNEYYKLSMCYYGDMSSCGIHINIYANNDTNLNKKVVFSFSPSAIPNSTGSFSNFAMSNCYLVIKNKTDIKAAVNCTCNSTGCFVDSDILEDDELCINTNDSSFYRLTTEQCKDREYLENLGFILASKPVD